MLITYMLWVLDKKTWRLISEGTDRAELMRDIKPKIRFNHRGYEYNICIDPVGDLNVTNIYCMTSQKGF